MTKMLVIAPHPDDEILGVGGTIRAHADDGGSVVVATVAGHRPPLYSEEDYEKTVAEARAAHEVAGVAESVFLDYPAVYLEDVPTAELNSRIFGLVEEHRPRILMLPYPDRHVDHRRIFDAALVAARPVRAGREIDIVACYETLSETHWNAPHIEPNFTPNWVVDITGTIDRKLEAMECFESQLHPYPAPRSLEALRALALFRGSQAGYGYGEAFHVVRMSGLAPGAPKAALG